MSTQPIERRVIPAWTLGDHLRKARSVARMDQREFAARLGVPPGSLAAWETDRARPRDVIAVARRIELLTGIPASWTLGLDDGGPRPDERPRLDSNQQPTDTTSPQVKAPKHATILPFYPRPRRVIPATPARRSSPLRRIS